MLTFNFQNFPVVETSRLVLRQITMADVDAVFNIRNQSVTGPYTARLPFESKKEALEIIKKMQDAYETSSGISWGITEKGNPTMIGSIGFWRIERENYRAEIGYALLPSFWNKGYMSESILSIIDFGLKHTDIHSVVANLHPDNIASEKVLLKAGFVKEGYFKENYFFDGKFGDTLTYGLVKKS